MLYVGLFLLAQKPAILTWVWTYIRYALVL